MARFINRETAYLLLGFIAINTKKKNLFYKKWDDKIKILERKVSEYSGNCKQNIRVTQDWRGTILPIDLYWFLRGDYPVPIPHVLFFSFYDTGSYNVEKYKFAGDLADKWLKDIFSRESFYKRNKEYFTRTETKYFLSCDWKTHVGNYDDLIDYFFETKIKANGLNLSLGIFQNFRNCFAHQIVIEYFNFLCNNKKYVNNQEIREINKFLKDEYISTGKNIDLKNHTYHSLKLLSKGWDISDQIVVEYFKFLFLNEKLIRVDEIREINKFLKNEYISAGKNIDFKNHTYHSLKRLSDEWHISYMIKNRFRHRCDHKIVQDYFLFICKNMKKVRNREEEILDICDFLNARINNEQDFDFENITWRELKWLSDEWHAELARERDELYRKKEEEKLNTEWGKSSIKDFIYEKDVKTWTIKEITTGKSLYEEGYEMRHCVFSYIDRCIQGYCHIFSVSCKNGDENDEKRIATLEISKNKRLEQARGISNSSIDNETAEIIKIWADENQIDCDLSLS